MVVSATYYEHKRAMRGDSSKQGSKQAVVWGQEQREQKKEEK